MTFYIDGYNVIHHSSRLRSLAMHDFEVARDELVVKVSRFCGVSGQHATIVFDGRGRQAEPSMPDRAAPGFQVIYSPTHYSADTVIERLVYSAANRRNIIVVSADRGLRELCRGLGALVMDSSNFLATVNESLEDGRERLSRHYVSGGLARIEDGLDEKTLDSLDELKSKLEP